MYSGVILATTATCSVLIAYLVKRLRRRSRLPPGQKRYFALGLGVIYAQPTGVAPWKSYKEWEGLFRRGLLYLQTRGHEVVVINDRDIATELLERRSLNYSSRPKMHMVDLIGRQENVGFQRYGPRLKQARKLVNESFGPRQAEQWLSVIEEESLNLLENLHSRPEDFMVAIKEFAGTFIVRLTYGQRLDPEYVRLVDELSTHTSDAMVPGRWWIDSFPILKYYPHWAPGGGFQVWAANARNLFRKFTQKPIAEAKSRSEDPALSFPSFVRRNITGLASPDPQREAVAAGTAASLYSGAVDTTTALLANFFLMMATHPEVQEKAFAQVAQYSEAGRLPGMKESSKLNYVEAVIKELHRFHPVVPLMPRTSETEDEYDGLVIPQNAWILTNIWAMAHDEKEYPDPDAFNPSRFIPSIDSSLSRDPRDITFGFGRRRCPGMAMGNAATYLAISRILATFRIEPISDEQGNVLAPTIDFTGGFFSSPKPFRCKITPRGPNCHDLIAVEKDYLERRG